MRPRSPSWEGAEKGALVGVAVCLPLRPVSFPALGAPCALPGHRVGVGRSALRGSGPPPRVSTDGTVSHDTGVFPAALEVRASCDLTARVPAGLHSRGFRRKPCYPAFSSFLGPAMSPGL